MNDVAATPGSKSPGTDLSRFENPALERLAARFAASFLEEKISLLPPGFEDIRDLMLQSGGPKPTERWLRERLAARQRLHKKKYKQDRPEKVRASKRRTNANWRERLKPEFDALRLSRPFVVI